MQNLVILKGQLRNIKFSHKVGDIVYNTADLIVDRGNNKEDVITLIYKELTNKYKEGDIIHIKGNLRSKSITDGSGKSNIKLYVFTYFDEYDPELEIQDYPSANGYMNQAIIEGRVCKLNDLRKTKRGVDMLHFILANNIQSASGSKFNSYIPCVVWGKKALEIYNEGIGNHITCVGKFTSREYTKSVGDDVQIKVAHELLIDEVVHEEITANA